MGEWGSGEMGRGANEQMEHGEMGNYGTGKRQGERWNGEIGPYVLGTALSAQTGNNTGIVMPACTYTESRLSNSVACGYSRLTS